MSAEWNSDDLARLLALEHAFGAVALISAGNFAYLSNTTPEDAVRQFRNAIEGSILDQKDVPATTALAMRTHLTRMFDHISNMAKMASTGPK